VTSSRRVKIACIAIVLALVIISLYIYLSNAYRFYELDITRRGRGYITDEVWYVSSSRVILLKIFKQEPRQPTNSYNATVIFREKPNVPQLREKAKEYNVTIREDIYFEKLNAIYISGELRSVHEFIKSLGEIVIDVIPGWVLPDNDGINNYINWEHPPLGKYLIALVMFTLGDNPFYWRIPIAVAGALTIIFTFLALYKATSSVVASLAASLLTLLDPISRALFSIALLDGYIALFTVIALYLVFSKKYRVAVVVTLIGACFKSSALFTTIPLLLLIAREEALKKSRSPVVFIESLLKYGVLTAMTYILILAVVSLPIMYYMGVVNWFNYSVIGAAKWHASIKCTDVFRCPVSSSPWDWFMGLNSFLLYIYPDGTRLYATGFYPLWSLSLALAVIFTPLIYTSKRIYGYVVLVFLGTLLGYVGLWIIGGRTQYSFYSIHFTPLIYINLVYVFTEIIPHRDLVKEAIKYWVDLFSNIITRIFIT